MPLVAAGQNALLSGGLGNIITHFSLHSGDPSTTGANELTGGSPAYARKAASWASASGGQRVSNTTVTFDVPAGTTVYHIGFFDALTSGTFIGYFPLGGFSPMAATIDAATDTFTSFAHGLSNTNQVLVYDIQAAGLQTGFTEGTVYFVIGATTDTFQLSTTSGGSASTVTTSFECGIQRVLPETFGAQGTLSIASAVTLDGRFV